MVSLSRTHLLRLVCFPLVRARRDDEDLVRSATRPSSQFPSACAVVFPADSGIGGNFLQLAGATISEIKSALPSRSEVFTHLVEIFDRPNVFIQNALGIVIQREEIIKTADILQNHLAQARFEQCIVSLAAKVSRIHARG